MKYYINYSDKAFKKQQNFALKMANKKGNFDNIIGYSREDIDKRFYEKNKIILDQARGGGYWLWKPYFINKKLEDLNDGDYLFYSDSGAFFLQKVDKLIYELEKFNQDIMGFELPLIEKQWTKKELFVNMGCNEDKYFNSNQILASFILIKKSDLSSKFFKEYLNFACNEINITDKYDSMMVQDENFIDHRHDQSVFSLLYKKYNLKPFKDPSQRGKYPLSYGGVYIDNIIYDILYKLNNKRLFKCHKYTSSYDLIMYHNRKGNPLYSYMKFIIKEILYKLKLTNKLIS